MLELNMIKHLFMLSFKEILSELKRGTRSRQIKFLSKFAMGWPGLRKYNLLSSFKLKDATDEEVEQAIIEWHDLREAIKCAVSTYEMGMRPSVPEGTVISMFLSTAHIPKSDMDQLLKRESRGLDMNDVVVSRHGTALKIGLQLSPNTYTRMHHSGYEKILKDNNFSEALSDIIVFAVMYGVNIISLIPEGNIYPQLLTYKWE